MVAVLLALQCLFLMLLLTDLVHVFVFDVPFYWISISQSLLLTCYLPSLSFFFCLCFFKVLVVLQVLQRMRVCWLTSSTAYWVKRQALLGAPALEECRALPRKQVWGRTGSHIANGCSLFPLHWALVCRFTGSVYHPAKKVFGWSQRAAVKNDDVKNDKSSCWNNCFLLNKKKGKTDPAVATLNTYLLY